VSQEICFEGIKVAKVLAVAKSSEPGMPKHVTDEIELIAGWGVEGDYHAGKTVRHRYLARKYPTRPNLRQVNLVHSELFPFLATETGTTVTAGQMGENITTEGLALMDLKAGTRLRIGESAVIEITEPRVPCKQLNYIDEKMLTTVAKKPKQKRPNAGMLGIVIEGGRVRAGDVIRIETSGD
jgi:MOSC domain-containing protein YiiM